MSGETPSEADQPVTDRIVNNIHERVGSEPDPVHLWRRCTFCGTEHSFWLNRDRYLRWQGGEHVQDVFPEMSPDERETLISGTCSRCWDIHMGGDDV